MRGRVLIVLLIILLMQVALATPLANAQPRSEHEIIINTDTNDIAMDMVLDSSGNVIVVGRSEISPYYSAGKFYAVKVSASGEILWTKTWNVTSSDILTGVTVDSADNVLMIGACNLTTDSVYAVIYKLDADGEELWSTEIDNINYPWNFWHPPEFCLDVEMYPESDDFFVVGSHGNSSYTTFVARYNSSGSMLWQSEWYSPSEYLGNYASLAWLSSQNWTVVSGLLFDEFSFYPYATNTFLVAFDFDGLQVWNHTGVNYRTACFEIATDECIYSTTYPWDIVRCTYDSNETWSFEMTYDEYHSIWISGLLANGTANVIGYGDVTSRIAGQAVVKSFRPAYEAPQPPQTFIFSFAPDGEFHWYDYLILGRLSSPCGCMFDTDGRLIVAGYTSAWSFETCNFYIVFGFIQTPFPSNYDSYAVLIFPIINLIALSSAWGFERVRTRHTGQAPIPPSRLTLRSSAVVLLLGELILYAAMWQYFIGPFAGGGGPPPLLVYYPSWVAALFSGLFYGMAIPAIACFVIWLRRPKSKS